MKKFITVVIAILMIACLSASALAASYVGFNGNANVRTGPGLGYASIGSCNTGSTLPYKGDSSVDGRGVRWYKVNFNGRTGWVSSKYGYLTDVKGTTTFGAGGGSGSVSGNSAYSAGGNFVQAVSGNTNVRTSPSLSGASLGTMHRGDSLSFLGSVSYDNRGIAWYQVSFNGRAAWVSSYYTALY